MEVLKTKEAAAFTKCSTSKLEKLRLTGEGPPFMKTGRLVLYEKIALEEWLKKNIFQSTSEYMVEK